MSTDARPVVFIAEAVDETWNRGDGLAVYVAVLRVGRWEVARWPLTYSEYQDLGVTDAMEEFVAAKLAQLFADRGKVTP